MTMDAETRAAHAAPARHVATGEGMPVGWMFRDSNPNPYTRSLRTETGHWGIVPDPTFYTASALSLGTPILPEEAGPGCLGSLDGKIWKPWVDDPALLPGIRRFAWLRPHSAPEPVPARTVDAAHPPEGYRLAAVGEKRTKGYLWWGP